MKVDEVIQEVQETIAILESQLNDESVDGIGLSMQIESEKIKLEALQQAKEREVNPPLTLEQLKERVGKPVWCKELKLWCVLIEDLQPDDRCGKYFIEGAYNVGYRICYSLKLNKFTLYDHEPKGE